MPPLKKSSKTYSFLKNKLDTVFSQYVRLRYSIDGYAQCVTCKKNLPIKQIQAGHFISRTYLATRWHELNVFPQCPGCNLFKKGAPDEFAYFIMNTYGSDAFDSLMACKHSPVKFTRRDLEDKISYYQNLLTKFL